MATRPLPDQPVFVQSNEVILQTATDLMGEPVRIWFKPDHCETWIWKGTLLGVPELTTIEELRQRLGRAITMDTLSSYMVPARRYRCRRKGYIWLNGAVAIKHGWSDS